MSPELRHLRQFVAVGEELHFTRAAERLHMAQQPLSAAIRRLEAELGVELLRRTTRRVELTEAGAALLERARPALRAADEAFAAAVAAGRGEAGELTLGVSPGARYALDALHAALHARHPQLRVRVLQASSQPLADEVLAGRLDLAVGFCALPAPGLAMRRLRDEPVVVAVPGAHRLANRAEVALDELREETFALVDPRDGPGYDAAVLALCAGAGFTPRTLAAAGGQDPWETAVVARGCVGLTARTAVQAARRDVQLLALTPPATFPLDLLWRAEGARPVVGAVLRAADGLRA